MLLTEIERQKLIDEFKLLIFTPTNIYDFDTNRSVNILTELIDDDILNKLFEMGDSKQLIT